jgi:hypothetical protein
MLTSCLTGLDLSVWQIKTKIVSCHTADSKPVKQEVNGTMILPPLVFPMKSIVMFLDAFYNISDMIPDIFNQFYCELFLELSKE